MNNMGSTTLLHPVFNNLEQVIIFCRVGLRGVRNIADDIIVYGETREDHDANLDKCLQRLSDKGLRLTSQSVLF